MILRFRRRIISGVLLIALIGFIVQTGFAQSQPANTSQSQGASSVLFENVQIFNGKSEGLSAPSNVLVVGNKIQKISTTSIPALPNANLTRINGGGRVLMPGLIDTHVHLFMETTPIEKVLSPNTPIEALFQQAQTNVTEMLLRGFTSVRDLAGPAFELKQAIDRGDVVGPRI